MGVEGFGLIDLEESAQAAESWGFAASGFANINLSLACGLRGYASRAGADVLEF